MQSRAMDLTAFFHSQRLEGLLVGDYNAYRSMCSRRLATLRKRLGRSNPKRYAAQPALTPGDVARDPSHAQLLLFLSERAWAHSMHLKSLMSEDIASATGALKSQIVSRLHKAQKHAFELCALLESSESNASDTDLLEATAYAHALRGLEAFEKKQWASSLRAFAVSRIIYSALLASPKNEVYQEQLAGTVDPSIRYAAYQLQLPRSMDIVAISRQYFPRQGAAHAVVAIERLGSQALAEQMDVEAVEPGSVRSVTWRGRTAPVEEADLSIALHEAQTAEAAYNSHDHRGSTDAFDAVLLAWQDAVDATRKAIDERHAEGMSTAEQKMQNLQLTWTVVNYAVICWRVGRNRVMIANTVSGSKRPRKDGQASDQAPAQAEVFAGKKLGHLKEEIVLYDAILQSLEQITNLPGVAADEAFTDELASKTLFFRALRTCSIARSHALIGSRRNALALFHQAHQYVGTALPSLLASPPAEASHKGLEVVPADAHQLHGLLAGEVARYQALVEMDVLAAEAGPSEQYGVLVERLHQWPEKVDFESGIVQWPPKVQPVPVKPMFLDIAWNFIEYPSSEAAKKEQAQRQADKKEAEEKKGLLGRLWGR